MNGDGSFLAPPPGGVTVRMYRIGHGDCFLLAFDGDEAPVFVLIDCGYKPGSQSFLPVPTSVNDVVDDIHRATGGRLDVVVVTHEHQDHLNGFTEQRFGRFEIGQLWMSWTESETDRLAIALRKRHADTMRTLMFARNELAAADPADKRGDDAIRWLDELIALEIGGEEPAELARASIAMAGRWTNKASLALLRSMSRKPPLCIYPHQEIMKLPGAKEVRVFALGPPHDEDAIVDLDPRGDEAFPRAALIGTPLDSMFAAALAPADGTPPFSQRYSVTEEKRRADQFLSEWYERHYGEGDKSSSADGDDVVDDDAAFRRIDRDWLWSADRLGLAMGEYTNNTSLVLAFEIGKGGKVLLFAADAQKGNWASWAANSFPDREDTVDVRELLGRTVLYKVGHHGSHNATLHGRTTDDYPNLAWLGRNKHAGEFTALIPAVRKWAMQDHVGWDHPLPSIKLALTQKCGGRVIQTDTDLSGMTKEEGTGERAWSGFLDRVTGTSLYFDIKIEAE